MGPEEAVRRAKDALGAGASTPAHALAVRRLDRSGEMYYLVEIGDPGAAVGVAMVDAGSGEIGVRAALPGTQAHLMVDAAAAEELAGGTGAECVWMPCRASRSPLYPLWEVKTARGVRYVDQQRQVWDRLEPAGLGG